MADPISGGTRSIQSTSIDQTQKTQDSGRVKAADTPYDRAQQQMLAEHIISSHGDVKDTNAQLREMLQQARAQGKAQGPKPHQNPHGFKRLLARAARHLNRHQGVMSFRGGRHGGPPAMSGLEKALTHVMSQLKAGRVLSGQVPAGKTPLETPALRPKELSPEEMGLEAQKPVLAPAGDATPYAPRTLQEQVMRMTPDQIKTAMQSADTTADMQSYLQAQLKYDEDPAVKEYIQAQQGRAQLLSHDVPIDDPAFQDLSARIAELKKKRPEPPKPEDFGIDGQKPDPALAGKMPLETPSPHPGKLGPEVRKPTLAPAGSAPLELPSQSPKELGLDGQKPVPASAGNVLEGGPPPYLEGTLQDQVTRMTPDQIRAALQQPGITADKQNYLKAQLQYNDFQTEKMRFDSKWRQGPPEDGTAEYAEYSLEKTQLKRTEDLYSHQPRPEDFGIDGQNPDPALAVAPTPEEEMNMMRDQLLKDIAER